MSIDARCWGCRSYRVECIGSDMEEYYDPETDSYEDIPLTCFTPEVPEPIEF